MASATPVNHEAASGRPILERSRKGASVFPVHLMTKFQRGYDGEDHWHWREGIFALAAGWLWQGQHGRIMSSWRARS